MTNHRSVGRPSESGKLMLTQVRVKDEDEAKTVLEMSPRERALSILAAQHIERTGRRQTVQLATPLPCSIIAGDDNCGKPAAFAYADEVHITGQFAMRHQWLLQPICRECALKAAEIYSANQSTTPLP